MKQDPKPKGKHTKPNLWDRYRGPVLARTDERLDPGVNFFVLILEKLGLPTYFSCEGHPDGFYVTFDAPYKKALRIKQCGFFAVEVEREGHWSIRIHMEHDDRERVDCLRW